MNDREALQQIANIANAQLGGGSPAPGTQVAPVTAKPSAFADLGAGNQKPAETAISPGQVVGVVFTIQAGAKNERNLRWFGNPGAFFDYTSWCIFDSGGGRVMYGDNVLVVGSLGFALDTAILGKLGAGQYTLGVAVDAPGNLAFQLVQN